MGRELCAFDLKKISYEKIINAIRKKDRRRFLYTIEVDPSYGKYHWDGHRKCGVSLSPEEAEKYGNICPVCKKPLTIGVLHRVEKLADRAKGFVPKDAIPFKRLLPLYEVISYSAGEGKLYSPKIERITRNLISTFGNELRVLLEVSEEELKMIVEDERIVNAIIMNREEKIKVIPGYDGVYGKPVFGDIKIKSSSPQKRIDSYF